MAQGQLASIMSLWEGIWAAWPGDLMSKYLVAVHVLAVSSHIHTHNERVGSHERLVPRECCTVSATRPSIVQYLIGSGRCICQTCISAQSAKLNLDSISPTQVPSGLDTRSGLADLQNSFMDLCPILTRAPGEGV